MKSIIYRLKKSKSYHKNFILSFVLTYAITVGIAIIVTVLEIDVSSSERMTFHCSELSYVMYFMAKILEAIIPTTITFCGAILLFQMSPQRIGTGGTAILTCISLLAALYIAISQISNHNYMFGLLIAAIPLNFFPIAVASRFYIESSTSVDPHKQECSDGSISGSIN